MDPFTAGISLILVQLCVALIMTGVFLATPTEKSTRYWAASGNLIALGVLIAVLNNHTPRPVFALNGTGMIITGLICQWHGILTFYKRKPKPWGWAIGAAFFVVYALMLYAHASFQQRSILLSITLLILLGLSFHAIWRGQNGRPRKFVRGLAQAAILVLMIGHALKLALAILQIKGILPLQHTPVEVIPTYLIPIFGTILFSTGLLLLYFERTVEENHHLATHDELSKLLNHRAIVAAGEREVNLAARLQRELTIAFIDIDLFKYFNDEFGHAAGNTVISDVAAILQQTCRSIDMVGRYGGEEFLVILPGVDIKGAAIIGQRLVNAVREYRFLDIHPVTISVGLALLPKNEECSWSQLLRRADAALYEAKDLGRDQFCV